jgi:hypothetical protein
MQSRGPCGQQQTEHLLCGEEARVREVQEQHGWSIPQWPGEPLGARLAARLRLLADRQRLTAVEDVLWRGGVQRVSGIVLLELAPL